MNMSPSWLPQSAGAAGVVAKSSTNKCILVKI